MPDTQTLSITNCSCLILSFWFPPRYCSLDYSECLRSFEDFYEACPWINTKAAKSGIIAHPLFSDLHFNHKVLKFRGMAFAFSCSLWCSSHSITDVFGILCRPRKCLVRPDFDLLVPPSVSFVDSRKKKQNNASALLCFQVQKINSVESLIVWWIHY